MSTQEQLALTAFQARIASNSLVASDIAVLTAALGTIIPIWGFGGSGQGPDTQGNTGQSDESNARAWFAPLYQIAIVGATGGPVPVPPSWLVPAWFIDPVAGNDANSGQAIGSPLKTWGQLQNLWGTNAPTLAQNTTITFLNSQPDNTDPVIFRPTIRNGAIVTIQGTTPSVVTAGVVLAGTLAKNRATGQLLTSNLGATSAIGQMVINTTAGKSSRAWIYKNAGGTTWALSQPLAPVTLGATLPPLEVDTWANGDTVNLVTLVGVNIVAIEPLYADMSGTQNNGVNLYQLNVLAPVASGLNSPVLLGRGVNVVECGMLRVQTHAQGLLASGTGDNAFQSIINVRNVGGLAGQARGSQAFLSFVGGFLNSPGPNSLDAGESVLFDGDFIFGTGGGTFAAQRGLLGLVSIDPTASVTFDGNWQATPVQYGLTRIWGAAGGFVGTGVGGSQLHYPGGAGAAVATFLNVALTIQGIGTAHSLVVGAPDVQNGNITLTAAHLDAAAGAAGFGGYAFQPSVGAITNF